MTEAQVKLMEELAETYQKAILIKRDWYFDNPDVVRDSRVMEKLAHFKYGFRAANAPESLKHMTPEQAKHIPCVQKLIEGYKSIYGCSGPQIDACGQCHVMYTQALTPFKVGE